MSCIETLRATETRIVGDAALPPAMLAAQTALERSLGLTLTGQRAVAFLQAADWTANQAALIQASERHLPLVVHIASAVEWPSTAAGFLLSATTPREAVDFALLARWLAEQALLPGGVCTDPTLPAGEPANIAAIAQWLGSASERIPTPTPAQQLLFGDNRRRVPRWYDPDQPVLLGVDDNPHSQALRLAGQQRFFAQHLEALLATAWTRYAEQTGRQYQAISSYCQRNAQWLVVTYGAAVPLAEAVAAELRSTRKLRLGVIGVRCLQPFPAAQLVEQLRGKRQVLVLEPVSTGAPLLQAVRASLARAVENRQRGRQANSDYPVLREKELPLLHGVAYNETALNQAELMALCLQLADAGQPPAYLGIDFVRPTGLVKRQALQDTLCRDYPDLAALGLRSTAESLPPLAETPVPLAAQRLQIRDGSYASLPRFWDQVGVLYRHGASAELTADPYVTAGAVPPLTASLQAQGSDRSQLPSFEPTLCTGCGNCWSVCPDSALGATAINARALLETGMRISGDETLRPVLASLAKQASALGQQATAPTTADALLQQAFTELRPALPEDRRAPLAAAVNTVSGALQDLPLAATEVFFQEPEQQWLTLALNPDACKGCGLCIAECEPRALTAAAPTAERQTAAAEQWWRWEQLPDTAGATIARVARDRRLGPLPALMLSRHCSQVLVGSDQAEPGCGAKLALRWVLAIIEFQQQPPLARYLEEIDGLRQNLQQAIHATLAQALPDSDLETLAAGLADLGGGKTPLSSLTERLAARGLPPQVDAGRLQQLVELTQAVTDLHWRLSAGPQGLGRARCSLALAPGAVVAWAAAWPVNAFTVPVTAQATPALAAGLCAGQVQQASAAAALLRQARLALDDPRTAARRPSAAPAWQELSVAERLLCPVLLLVGDAEVLGGRDLGALLAVLNGELPIKVLLLADPPADQETVLDASLAALARQRAYMAQTSLAAPEHLLDCVQAALAFSGPALLQVHAPSPQRHGLAPEQLLATARQSLATQHWPVFRYDPEAAEARVDLSGNPVLANDSTASPGWRLLQELAGQVTPASVQAAAQQAEAQAAELAALHADYETRLQNLQQELEQALTQRVQRNLLKLAGYGAVSAAESG